ncbi:hypothetical protein NC653_029801 [Populus alba x Populus x berolinensis]|uniref:Large ribosomal subunit protein bL9c n=1 Tax=Populus alba x Populus x berolinensis TaxID=444605 RepID=A0AAD6M3E2_9ROSI|nr:hypothetical protein NC653_029801 [Populus alba x Populus x berolinensis]
MIQEKNISGQREEESGINIIMGGKNTWEAPRTVRRECYNDFELVSLHSPSYVLSHLASLYQAKPRQNPKLKKLSSLFQNRDFGFLVQAYRTLCVDMACIQHSRNALRRIIAKETNLKSSDGAIHPLLYACQGVRYKKLEVILTTSIEKLGKAGQTVKVAPGHFRNHLMPKLLAVPNIEKFAHLIREQRKIYQPQEEEEVKVVKETMEDKMKEYETAAKRLVKAQLAFRVGINTAKFRARESKDAPIEILSPVTKDDILKEVTRQFNVQIEPDNVHLPSPLAALGEFEVPLRFPKSIPMPEGKVKWTLKVKIRGK